MQTTVYLAEKNMMYTYDNIDMGMFESLYPQQNSSEIITKPPIVVENPNVCIEFSYYHKKIVKNREKSRKINL